MSSQRSYPAYIQGGQIPFFRTETVDPTGGELSADAVLFGVPYDGGTTYQPGARLGPYHVRRCSALVSSFHPTHGIDVFSTIDAVDGGNAMAPPFDAGMMREVVAGWAGAVSASGAAPFVCGGDHSISLPILRALARQHGPLAVVHVDAHFDTSDGALWGEDYHHGTPIRHAIAEDLVERGQLYQLGLRGAWKDAHEADIVDGHDTKRFSADQIGERSVAGLMTEIRAAIGDRPTYITFDIDAVDPAFAPGTGTPVPGGLTSREALAIVRGLAGTSIVGMDVVEVAPAMDHADITSLLAAQLLYEGLALYAVAKHG